jgi:hypothetical protein
MNQLDDRNDDDLDRMLREAAQSEPHIDDAGFTRDVMTRVPAAGRTSLRRRILAGFTAAAVVSGLLTFGGLEFIWNAVHDLVAAGRVGAQQVSVLVLALVFYWMLYTVLRAGRR